MKTFFQSLCLIPLLLLLSNCTGNTQSADVFPQDNTVDRIEVLDFHTDHRCKTCLTIEKLTKTILADDYAGEMEEGLITFQLINVDQQENLPIAQKFGAFGTSLMLNVIQDGQERQIDLTDFAFMNADNEATFTQGLKEKLDAELKNLQL